MQTKFSQIEAGGLIIILAESLSTSDVKHGDSASLAKVTRPSIDQDV